MRVDFTPGTPSLTTIQRANLKTTHASDKTGTIESQQLIDRKQPLRLIVGADHLLDIRFLQMKRREEKEWVRGRFADNDPHG